MTQNLRVSPAALEYIRSFIGSSESMREKPVRIYKRDDVACPGGFGSTFGRPAALNDEILQVGGIVFFVDKSLLEGIQYLLVGFDSSSGIFVEKVGSLS